MRSITSKFMCSSIFLYGGGECVKAAPAKTAIFAAVLGSRKALTIFQTTAATLGIGNKTHFDSLSGKFRSMMDVTFLMKGISLPDDD